MQHKETIFFINGPNTARLAKCADSKFYLLNPTNYYNSKVEILEASQHNYKLNTEILRECFTSKDILQKDEVINIALIMHGHVKNNDYLLETELEPEYQEEGDKETVEIPAEQFLHNLVEATGGKKLNIFFDCCYGANIHDFIEVLPKGSKITSLSDRDKPTDARGLYNSKMPELVEYFYSSSENSIFKYFLPIYALSCKLSVNTPVISFLDNNGTKQLLSLDSYATEYWINNEAPLSLNLLQKLPPNIVDESIISELIQKDQSSFSAIINMNESNFFELAYTSYTNGKQENFKNTLEGIYYPKSSLNTLNFDFKKYTDLLVKQHSLKEKLNGKDNLVEEYETLNIKALQNTLEQNERTRAQALEEEIGKSVQKLNNITPEIQNFVDQFRDQTPLGLHANNMEQYNLGTVDMSDPINNIIPYSNVLLGIGAIDLVEHC